MPSPVFPAHVAKSVATKRQSETACIEEMQRLASKNLVVLTVKHVTQSDRLPAVRFMCSRGGVAKDVDDGAKSLKCGCEFGIIARDIERSGVFSIVKRKVKHTGGCEPSELQFAMCRVKSGKQFPHNFVEVLASTIGKYPSADDLRRAVEATGMVCDTSGSAMRDLGKRISTMQAKVCAIALLLSHA